MKTTEEKIEVMQHFADGGEVECRTVREWFTAPNPTWNWGSADYRIKQPVDPYAELKVAAVDPTKQIRCIDDTGANWGWIHHPSRYEIRDKPKSMKKVKLLAWFDGIQIRWVRENAPIGQTWKHVSYEDKEIEVEE